jgi:hypothetical protein
LNGHCDEVLLGGIVHGNTEGGNAIRGHELEREFRRGCVFVGFQDRGNNDQEDVRRRVAGQVARVVDRSRRGTKSAKTISQEAGPGPGPGPGTGRTCGMLRLTGSVHGRGNPPLP